MKVFGIVCFVVSFFKRRVYEVFFLYNVFGVFDREGGSGTFVLVMFRRGFFVFVRKVYYLGFMGLESLVYFKNRLFV